MTITLKLIQHFELIIFGSPCLNLLTYNFLYLFYFDWKNQKLKKIFFRQNLWVSSFVFFQYKSETFCIDSWRLSTRKLMSCDGLQFVHSVVTYKRFYEERTFLIEVALLVNFSPAYARWLFWMVLVGPPISLKEFWNCLAMMIILIWGCALKVRPRSSIQLALLSHQCLASKLLSHLLFKE